jgi:hypothetical protein
MANLKFYRKLGEVWVFDLTWLDRTGARQSIAGASSFKANWYQQDGADIVIGDTSGFTTVESSVATYGDFQYKRTTLTPFSVGTYRLDFQCVMNGEVVKNPERGYVIVEVSE